MTEAMRIKTTYELSLYDNYMELYSIDPKAATEGEATFLTNFFYLSSRDNEFTFYTYKEASMKLPRLLKRSAQMVFQNLLLL